MMTKASYTDVGKVWGGDIESVPSDLLEALKSFAAVTRWTGGGEIEFVEEIVPSTASGIGRWAIDFNPRFPAWIFASTYAGCNLPALLLQQAQQAARDPAARWAHPSLAGGNATRATFVRSVVEVPTAHIEMRRTLPAFVAPTAAASAGKHGAAKPLHPIAKFPVLPQACVDDLDADAACCAQLKAATKQVQYIAEDLHRLIDACTHRLAANPAMIEHSPRFVLNIDSVDVLLKRNKCIMETAIASANASAAGNDRLPLQLQMCLSVKTQPNALVVRAAETSGYLAECIDMAEVYHSVENGGFPFERVVLTGPGKWWDRLSAFERAAQFNHAGPRKLHAVFADSLADLRTIAARLLDPAHSLDADVIGIRWSPVSDRPSRFGLDPQDTEVVRGAAEVIASLPAGRFRLGMHFHHAASFMGGQVWFTLANAYAVFCGEFSALCGQPVSTIDFGGGFDPHFLESEYVARELPALFATVHEHCNRMDRPPAAGPVTVQFELGKSVSEDAGGVLTRIMAVRERRNHKPERESTDSDEGHKEKRTVHALIVDTTVADISTPNGKAVFLVRFPEPGSPEGAVPRCIPLPAGDTQIWGRTCMEWDLIKGGFMLPADVQEGDLLLIAGCGAYDISMQYDFGDGVGRTKNVVVL
jgi:diaminopimelate decarboxylase